MARQVRVLLPTFRQWSLITFVSVLGIKEARAEEGQVQCDVAEIWSKHSIPNPED